MTDWESAVCRSVDPELFFPKKGGNNAQAKSICNGRPAKAGSREIPPCPVREACLQAGLVPVPGSEGEVPQGIWAGLSQQQRQDIKIARGRRLAS